jgi:hypothetical protein
MKEENGQGSGYSQEGTPKSQGLISRIGPYSPLISPGLRLRSAKAIPVLIS